MRSNIFNNILLIVALFLTTNSFSETLDSKELRLDFDFKLHQKEESQEYLTNKLKSYTSNILNKKSSNVGESLNIRGFEIGMNNTDAIKKLKEIYNSNIDNCTSNRIKYTEFDIFDKILGDIVINCSNFPFFKNKNNNLTIYFVDKQIKLIILEVTDTSEMENKYQYPEYYHLYVEKFKTQANVEITKTTYNQKFLSFNHSDIKCINRYNSSLKDVNNSILYVSGCIQKSGQNNSSANNPYEFSDDHIQLISGEFFEISIHERLKMIFKQINDLKSKRSSDAKSKI